MDCNQFNIDHIELRTGIDVPQIKRNYCELTDTSRTVSSTFEDRDRQKSLCREVFPMVGRITFRSGRFKF